MVQDHTVPGEWIVIAIISWGHGCARTDNPGVYTKVTKYIEWIKKNIEDD